MAENGYAIESTNLRLQSAPALQIEAVLATIMLTRHGDLDPIGTRFAANCGRLATVRGGSIGATRRYKRSAA